MFGWKKRQAQPTEQPKQAYIVSRNAECWTQGREILEQAHILIAGSTGCGKSTLIHKLMWSALAFTPGSKQFIIIDMKYGVEMKRYRNLPHVLRFAQTDKEALSALDYAMQITTARLNEMNRTDQTMYNGSDIYVVIDELGFLLQACGYEALSRLTALSRIARAARVHLLMASQDPSRRGCPSSLQINCTCLIGMKCRDAQQSRQIIGMNGCENLPRHGTAFLVINSETWMLPIVPISDEEGRERIAYWSDPKNYTVYA